MLTSKSKRFETTPGVAEAHRDAEGNLPEAVVYGSAPVSPEQVIEAEKNLAAHQEKLAQQIAELEMPLDTAL